MRRPVRQYQVAGVLLDGAYPHVRLGLEADSRIWRGGRLDVQRNTDKANVLLAHGWRVLRFTLFDLTPGAVRAGERRSPTGAGVPRVSWGWHCWCRRPSPPRSTGCAGR